MRYIDVMLNKASLCVSCTYVRGRILSLAFAVRTLVGKISGTKTAVLREIYCRAIRLVSSLQNRVVERDCMIKKYLTAAKANSCWKSAELVRPHPTQQYKC